MQWAIDMEKIPANGKPKMTQATLDTVGVNRVVTNWSKEGLLDHIVQLIVSEDLVGAK